jgi:hypothetical protein
MDQRPELTRSPDPPVWLAWLRGRAHSVPLLCLAIVLLDQLTKAVQPTSILVINPGGAAIFPSPVDDTLWRSHTFGGACDTAGAAVLLAALVVANRLVNPSPRVAATAVLAGLLSNLLDRMGASSLFHDGLPRGCIDWIPVPMWPAARTNIADIVVSAGVLALAYHPARRAIRASQQLIRNSRSARTVGAGTGLLVIAIWTTFWQANRDGVELKATIRPETATHCATTLYTGDGMDWLSYRPKAGPLPYRAAIPTDRLRMLLERDRWVVPQNLTPGPTTAADRETADPPTA